MKNEYLRLRYRYMKYTAVKPNQLTSWWVILFNYSFSLVPFKNNYKFLFIILIRIRI